MVESTPKAKIALLRVAPGMSPEQLEEFTRNSDAVILVVYATGTSPESLNSAIKKRTEEGIPVFLVSNNPGDIYGIVKIIYEPQVKSKDAGAIPLEKVNINNIDTINAAIEEEFSKGKSGAELGEAIREKFAYREDESRPIPAWEDPVEINKQESLYRQTLKKQGLSEEQIETILKDWRG